MVIQKELNIKIGSLPSVTKNLITDVLGVKVGHITLNDNHIKTGVTAILPHCRFN